MLGQDQNQAAFLLLRFLIALPIGALLGGWIATRIGDRIVACAGLLIAAGGYYLVSGWPADVLSAHHDLGFVTLPMLDTDLAIAGLGLGLVIAPLTSATLRVVPAAQHGIASAAVVVARMIGMLIGVAALSAWGLYRFNQYLQERLAALPPADPDSPGSIIGQPPVAWREASRQAYVLQYGEIFKITCIVCVVGALLGLLISGRHEHADEPAEPVDAAATARRCRARPQTTTRRRPSRRRRTRFRVKPRTRRPGWSSRGGQRPELVRSLSSARVPGPSGSAR